MQSRCVASRSIVGGGGGISTSATRNAGIGSRRGCCRHCLRAPGLCSWLASWAGGISAQRYQRRNAGSTPTPGRCWADTPAPTQPARPPCPVSRACHASRTTALRDPNPQYMARGSAVEAAASACWCAGIWLIYRYARAAGESINRPSADTCVPCITRHMTCAPSHVRLAAAACSSGCPISQPATPPILSLQPRCATPAAKSETYRPARTAALYFSMPGARAPDLFLPNARTRCVTATGVGSWTTA